MLLFKYELQHDVFLKIQTGYKASGVVGPAQGHHNCTLLREKPCDVSQVISSSVLIPYFKPILHLTNIMVFSLCCPASSYCVF